MLLPKSNNTNRSEHPTMSISIVRAFLLITTFLFSSIVYAERTIDLRTISYNVSGDHTVFEFLKIETIPDKNDPSKGKLLVSCNQDSCKTFVTTYDSSTVVELLSGTKLNTLDLMRFSGEQAILSVRNDDKYLISIRFRG